MLFYTKSYLGQRLGLTFNATELDGIANKSWEQLNSTFTTLGSLALFTSVAPFIAAVGPVLKGLRSLQKALNKDDKLTLSRRDFRFNERNGIPLQSGIYMIWEDGLNPRDVRNTFRLTGPDDEYEPHQLVNKNTNVLYKLKPYIVFSIENRDRPEYENFEIEGESARILEEVRNGETFSNVLNSVKDLANAANDGNQLVKIKKLLGLYNSSNGSDKEELKKQIEANFELFSSDNTNFIKEILKNTIQE